MTKDEIIEMAKKCGAYPASNVDGALLFWSKLQVEAFAKLVVEKEREACAMIVEENANRCGVDTVAWMLLASNAQAIRAKGQA